MKGLIFLILLSPCWVCSQSLNALKTDQKIILDGQLKEDLWQNTTFVSDFTCVRPNPGRQAQQNTAVAMAYNHEAIYFAVKCYDKMDSVSQVFTSRDDLSPNADVFSIYLDTYNDNQNGFYFGVTSQGVQLDAKINPMDFNDQLNLVWNSQVYLSDSAWTIEIRIPFSAIRFPAKNIQEWGINFSRQMSRNREQSAWSPVSPDFENYLVKSGSVEGIEGIDPPLRLALMPYLSSYVNKSPDSNTSSSFNGGMDIKYGLNEAFTLDVTLVPDFGQVVFDNQVLNLSPFEIQFNENRQFFTEGTELFNKSGLFYSRRIGIQPPAAVLNNLLNENERISSVPGSTRLYNATKLTGRTDQGLGIGVFNALTAPQFATAINQSTLEERQILASPLTNFNVLVLDQNLKNNSSVTLTNTNVTRAGSFYDANVTAFNSVFNNKSNDYYGGVNSSISNKLFTDSLSTGFNWGLWGGKQKGKFVYNASYFEESATYDPNDLGYNQNNNRRIASFYMSYRIFKPFWILNRFTSTLSLDYNRLFAPNVYTGTNLDLSTMCFTKKFNAFGLNLNSSLTESYDYFEPRLPISDGYFFMLPTWLGGGGWISTNYQKKFAVDLGGNFTKINRNKWIEWEYNVSLRLRLTNKMLLTYSLSQGFQINNEGYAVQFGMPVDTSFSGILFGSRNRNNITNLIDFNYSITNRMNLSFRLRHYRSYIIYNSFYSLQNDGSLAPIVYNDLDLDGASAYNVNFNAFTIDFVYRWVFQPGSEINLVWKNAVFQSDKRVAQSYFYNLGKTLQEGPSNSISLKVIYWLDAQKLKKKKEII